MASTKIEKATLNKTEKTTIEKAVAKIETSAKTKVKIINTYIGLYGTFYAGKEYDLENDFAKDLIKNGDAKQC